MVTKETCFLVCLESAPSRTLARRKLTRTRITIDTDLVFHGNNNNCDSANALLLQHAPHQPHKPEAEDTDRWVEEQFNLAGYEDQSEGVDVRQMKETDILSDDDEYCKSVRSVSAEPDALETEMDGLNLQGEQTTLSGQVETRSDITQSVKVDQLRVRVDPDSADTFTSCGISVSRCATSAAKLVPLKQYAVEGAAHKDRDVIWVRRDDFTNGCNSDIF